MGNRRNFGSVNARTSKSTGHKYYEARYRPPIEARAKWSNLPQYITKNFPQRHMAEAWLSEAKSEIDDGRWIPPVIASNRSAAFQVTFGEYAANFVENRRKKNGEPLAITTKQKYEQYLRDYLIPVLGNKLMGGITPKDIQAWADTMPLGAAGEGGAIKRKVWELLRAIFNHAVETPLDMDGTTLLTKSPVLIEVSKPCSDVAYGNVSAEELETLYQAMTPRFAPVIYLIGIMGMRPGKVTALQRQDIVLADDLSGGIIHITKTAKPIRVPDSETGGGHRDILIGRPKTRGSVRDLEIPASLAGILDKHIRTYVLDAPDSFLFTGERTHTVVDDQRLRNAWYNARRSVPRLEQRGLRLYDLRHRAASVMKTYTNSDKTIMKVMGHTQLSTDLHYQHAIDSENAKILEGMEHDIRGLHRSPNSEKVVYEDAPRQQLGMTSQLPATPIDDAESTPELMSEYVKSMPLNTQVAFLEAMTDDVRTAILNVLPFGVAKKILAHISEKA